MARILLADDERDFRLSVAEALRISGHEVASFGTADEALAALRKDPFDVLLTDLRMPGRSGLALLREAADQWPDSILIVLTAYGSLESAIEALRIGAHDYMLKPLRIEALRHKIEILLRHRETAAENRLLRAAPNSAATASSTGLGGSTTSRAIASVSTTTAPRSSNIRATADLPEPMPPVKPTII